MVRLGARALIAAAASTVITSATATAQTVLSEEALFRRCHAHLTQQRPPLADPLLAAVKDGGKTAVQACQEVFNRALLTANGGTTLADPSDMLARSIVHTFNELHRSWAREQNIFDVTDNFATRSGSEPWYEDSPMGPYITRALLSPSFNVDSVTQGTDFVQPVREVMDPPKTYAGVPSGTPGNEREFRLGAQHPFAPKGDILGVRSVSLTPISFFGPIRFTNLSSMPDFANIGLAPAAMAALTDLNLTTVDAVNGPLVETEQIALRIEGQLLVPANGSYTIYLNVDDGGSLILDGTRIIDRQSAGESNTALTLTQGTHSLVVEYRQRTGNARIIMSWQGPGIPTKQVIPSSAFSGLQAAYYTHYQPAPIQFTGNLGGGYLGNHNYLLTTYREATENFVPDGALLTNRSVGRAIISDALCREVPVVREEDVQQFVLPQSQLPFRQQAACTTCHASLDAGISGLIRGLRWNNLQSVFQDSPLPDLYGILGMRMLIPSLGEQTTWSDEANSDYAKRSAYGKLFFRNIHGQLVNQEVRSFEELGAAIRSQDDYYVCFAKRYYHYFMGISVELGDPGSPSYQQRNPAEAHHYNKVLELGNQLRTSKSLSQLIFNIISSEEYRLSDFGVSYQGSES